MEWYIIVDLLYAFFLLISAVVVLYISAPRRSLILYLSSRCLATRLSGHRNFHNLHYLSLCLFSVSVAVALCERLPAPACTKP